jgi:hypothetical protein
MSVIADWRRSVISASVGTLVIYRDFKLGKGKNIDPVAFNPNSKLAAL